jgi:hypothetical protein
MHLSIDRYAAWSQLDKRESARTRAAPVAPYQPLQPLDRYPVRIADRRFHGIFGAPKLPASVTDDDRLPGIAAIRREIRRSGRRLAYRALGLTVLGTQDTTIFLEGPTGRAMSA